jgi:chromosome segregation ATPase
MKRLFGAAPQPSAVKTSAEAAPAEVRRQLVALNKELEEAASKFQRLQGALAAQQQLEQLLKEGRVHLQDLRSRLKETTAERDLLKTALTDHATAHRLDIERLQGQIQEQTRDALAQQTLVEQREREMLSKHEEQRQQLDALRQQIEKATADRDGLAVRLGQREREMLSKHEEQRQQLDALRQQFETATAERDGLAARLDEREREMLSKEEEQQRHFGRAIAERDRLASQLEVREVAEKQLAADRAEQQATFERLLSEARSNQREMIQELDEQSQQNRILREAAMRAQSLARQIMNAREPAPKKDSSE